jgi:nicotinate-nucleotide adenylyltransferase
MSVRIGILGGSFDPIHFGHLAIAEEARLALALDRVLFVPAARQPLKLAGHAAPAAARLEMTRLACASNDAFVVSTAELERPGPSFTVDTLATLRAAGDDELFFILGADALGDFPRWHAADRIIRLARVVVFDRPGTRADTASVARALPGLDERLTRIEGPLLDLSSTVLRQRVARGLPIRYQTPDPVVDFIAAHDLYGG